MTRNPDTPIKQRVTFYAPKTVLDIIETVQEERNDDSITDAVCQIIIEYGARRELQRIEAELKTKFDDAAGSIEILKNENEVLRDRLSLIEAKYAAVNRAVAEMHEPYTKAVPEKSSRKKR
ncbi:MAG: hypothetical protein Q4Q04_01225 [Methanocorpusculum sp.]|nr:hypothetical protein [Methanocorpusculum sp.]